jgi:hypothetical protein
MVGLACRNECSSERPKSDERSERQCAEMCWWIVHLCSIEVLMYLSKHTYLSSGANVANCFWCPDSFSQPIPCKPLITHVGLHKKTMAQRFLSSMHEAEVSWL